jgi:hypothetical protein
MFLKQFKGTGPGTIFLIVVTLLTLWASAFIRLQGHFSLYFDLDPMPLYGILSSLIGTNPMPGIIFTLALVSMMAFLLVNLNTTLFFINERTFVPALIYILLSGFFPQYQLLNPAIFGAIFLMLAFRRIMEAYRIPGTAYNFFDAGLLIGTGSLFYANLIWFGLIVIVGIALLRTGNAKEIGISVIGLITPFFLTFGIYYISDNDLKELLSVMENNLFGRPASYVFTNLTVTAILYTGLITLLSIIFLLMSINNKKIKSRKTFYLLLWIFMISISVYIIVPTVSVEIVWITGIPISYFLSHYFVFARKKLVPEILFTILFIMILFIQILYLR